MSNKKPNQNSIDPSELSALIETKPELTDDRTINLTRSTLRRAEKEAKKTLNQTKKKLTLGRFFRKLLSLSFWIALPSIAGVLVAITQKWIPSDTFGPEIAVLIERAFSSVPNLSSMSQEDHRLLESAVQTPLETEGPQTRIAVSQENLSKPVLFVATNLPSGTAFSFYVMGSPGKVLTEKKIDVRFPIKVEKHFAQSRSLHQLDGSDLPPGEYEVYLTEDAEQLPAIKTLLDNLPQISTPDFMSGKHKVLVSRALFLGGPRDSSFASKQKAFHEGFRNRAYSELQVLQNGLTSVEVLYKATTDTRAQFHKKPNKKLAEKEWMQFHLKWQTEINAPKLKTLVETTGTYYSKYFLQLRTLKKQVELVHSLQHEFDQNPKLGSEFLQKYQGIVANTNSLLAEMKDKTNGISRAIADPSYVPPTK